MTVFEAIEARASIRRYQERPVEPEKIARILEAGRLAPSARNQQNWKFIVVTGRELRERLAGACCGQRFVAQAPVALVVCSTRQGVMTCGQAAHTVDCSIALSYMVLEAAELGLGTCWLGAFYEDQVKAALGIPADCAVVAVTPLGYPAGPKNPRSRKELGDIVFHERWGDA